MASSKVGVPPPPGVDSGKRILTGLLVHSTNEGLSEPKPTKGNYHDRNL